MIPPGRGAITGIVLAGGRSSRFGSDKLIAPVRGRALVEHAVLALAPLCSEVLVVTRPVGDPPPLPNAVQAGVAVRVVRDPEPFGGPLVGLLAGLERAAEPIALVAAGDMPSLAPPVLAAMTQRLTASGGGAAALVQRGRVQPFPLAVRVGAATDAVRRVLGAGERRFGEILRLLVVEPIDEADWRPLDPEAATLRDVDRREDLPR